MILRSRLRSTPLPPPSLLPLPAPALPTPPPRRLYQGYHSFINQSHPDWRLRYADKVMGAQAAIDRFVKSEQRLYVSSSTGLPQQVLLLISIFILILIPGAHPPSMPRAILALAPPLPPFCLSRSITVIRFLIRLVLLSSLPHLLLLSPPGTSPFSPLLPRPVCQIIILLPLLLSPSSTNSS